MGISLNHAALSRAESAAKSGSTTDALWDAPVGSQRKKDECLGIDHDEPEGSAESLKYPIFSGGKLNWNAVHAAASRAAQNGASEIADAAKRLGEMRKDKGTKMGREGGEAACCFVMAAGHEEPELSLGSNFPYPKQIDGQTCHYLWKESLKPGTWRDARGIEQVITPQRIDSIISSFALQKSKGVLPFIPPSHKDRGGDRNMGYIVDARKSATGSLELLHQLIGDDARLAASRNGTSIYTFSNFKIHDGTVIPELIDHNAILPDPAIPDLKGFEPAIAASRGHGDAVIYMLASDRSTAMAKLSDEHKKRLKAVLPDNATIPDEPDNEYFVKLLESRSSEHKTAMSRVETERDEAKRGLELARGAQQQQPPQMNAEQLYDRRKWVRAECEHALAGKFSKPCLDALKDYMIGTETAPNTMMLSRENPDNLGSPVRAEKLISILAMNAPVPPTGVQSGIQMSRETPGQQSDEDRKKQEEVWRKEGEAAKKEQLAARGITV